MWEQLLNLFGVNTSTNFDDFFSLTWGATWTVILAIVYVMSLLQWNKVTCTG